MKIADFQSKLALFAKNHKDATFTVNDGRFDVSEGDFDHAAIANRVNDRELIVVVYHRNGFCSLRFERGVFAEAWRDSVGDAIAKEIGVPDARNVFGNLPTHTTPKAAVQEGDPTNPFQRRDLKQQLADAARSGDMAAAISAI